MSLRRLHVTRALLAGLASVLAAAAATYLVAPLFRIAAPDPIRLLARLAGVDPADTVRTGAVGWLLALAGSEVVSLVFAALWDALPPRTRPISKAVIFCGLLFLIARLPSGAVPAAAAFAVALGLSYRPHAAPPEREEIVAHPRLPR